jgi:hypothetical protein
MKKRVLEHGLRYRFRTLNLAIQIFVLILAGFSPLVVGPNAAYGLELSDRKATISTSKASQTDVEFVFSFNIPNTAATKAGIIYEFCTTPLGTCNTTGWTLTGFTHDAQTGWPNNATAFAAHGASDENDCTQSTDAATMICFERDETVATATTGGAVTHTISGINTDATFQTVYIRIATYSDDDFQTADLLDSGVVAVAIVRQLTVNGRIQERLAFCVFAIDDAAAMPADCATAPTTTTIDIGIIDSTTVAISPVDNNPPTTQGNDFYGGLQVNTNAQDGVAITYFPETASLGTNELRSFRVPGATCDVSGTSTIDQCFIDASNAGETFTAGTERFGMYIPCIDTTQGITANLTATTAYNGSDNTTTTSVDCENEAATDFAWSDSTTAASLASSTTVVEDEIVKVRFAAAANAITPTGSYTVVSTYIATPQF